MKNFSTSSQLFSRQFSLNLGGRIMDLSYPVVMGIINATPDSFYNGGAHADPNRAALDAGRMLEQGAAILDVGAVSSRPGAPEISEEEEIARLSPVIERIRNDFPECPVSVDTWRSGVARSMHERFEIHMINDISAGQLDERMFTTMASLEIPYIMMHMQGTPETMQKDPQYSHVTDDIIRFFSERVLRLRKLGVRDVILDPGFGFGKTLEHNYHLLRELDAFAMLELPLLVGISRKSMIYKVLETEPEHALNGSTAAHMAALMNGARILRVHDVKEAVETVRIFQEIAKIY
jgi:dihydropteroate synthase